MDWWEIQELMITSAIIIGVLVPVFALTYRFVLKPAWKDRKPLPQPSATGLEELRDLAAAAILGKEGFTALRGLVAAFFKKHGPPEDVSRRRYRVGLAMFTFSLALGWAAPYWGHLFPGFEEHPYLWGAAGDLTFLASLFFLGGEFWDKWRSLFFHGAKVVFPEPGREG